MPPLEKARIKNCDTNVTVEVLFNPEEYTLNKDNNFAQTTIPGLSGPVTQFVSGNMQTLEMELFFDSYETHAAAGKQPDPRGVVQPRGQTDSEKTIAMSSRAGDDVRLLTQQISDLLKINPETHAPPILEVGWASLNFTCVLVRVSQKFTMFNADGKPVRAKLTVTFNEYIRPVEEAQETRRETADYTKIYVVAQGENLSAVAFQVYKNPLLWRPIARYNHISDPRRLAVGQRLLIPRLPYRDPETGEVYGQ
jgi:nucleoid-associated protein YgaU